MAGLTLLELLVVLAIAALATGGVALALRDDEGSRLQREADRLGVLLEAARAQARATGLAVRWQPRGPAAVQGFEFMGLPAQGAAGGPLQGPRPWLDPQTRAIIERPEGATSLPLGPEPLIGAQRIRLQAGAQRLWLVTDGLGPFRAEAGGS